MISIGKRKKVWKHIFFLFFIFALGVISVAGGYIFWFSYVREVPPPPDVEGIRPVLRNGDVILRSGIGFWSELFRSRNKADKRFSHVGIVRKGSDGKFYVIHSEGDDTTGQGKVFEDTLEHFVGESDAIGIARLKTGDPNRFAEHALSFLDRPFDWKFDKTEDSAIYCTELIDLSLRKMDPELHLREHDGLILPEACLDPEIFTEIPISK